jgi:hypothetical protein
LNLAFCNLNLFLAGWHMKTADELYEEREKRLRDAIELKEPDRVPVMMGGGGSKEHKLPASAAFYDIAAFKAATIKSIVEFQPDAYWAALFDNPGVGLEAMDPKRTKWPGYNLPDNIPSQHIETESLKEDEYDLFLSDPSDFIVRYHLPRIYGSLEPFAKLPPIRAWATMGLPTASFVTPEFQKTIEAICIAGKAMLKSREVTRTFNDEMAALGFPPYSHGGSMAPFDQVTNTFRGLHGVSKDMYRRPEKLLQICELYARWNIQSVKGMARIKGRGKPRRGVLPLTRGGEAFMSLGQFRTFYWPSLKRVLMAMIESGTVPILFCEGNWTSRLETLRELPQGKYVCHFQHFTDIARAKDILGGHACIVGSVSPSLMELGSVQDVEQYCRDLITAGGKGGGFILSRGESFAPKYDNVKAVLDAAKKYGTY